MAFSKFKKAASKAAKKAGRGAKAAASAPGKAMRKGARAVGESVPGYGYVLGMHAFGLEENGLYAQAEETGRRALEISRRDPWAVHAVTHTFEMRGSTDQGIEFLRSREADWAPDNGFAFHNYWHLALFHLDLGQYDEVLAIYDEHIRPRPTQVALENVDASALLWRLELRGVDVGSRWQALADGWEAQAH